MTKVCLYVTMFMCCVMCACVQCCCVDITTVYVHVYPCVVHLYVCGHHYVFMLCVCMPPCLVLFRCAARGVALEQRAVPDLEAEPAQGRDQHLLAAPLLHPPVLDLSVRQRPPAGQPIATSIATTMVTTRSNNHSNIHSNNHCSNHSNNP